MIEGEFVVSDPEDTEPTALGHHRFGSHGDGVLSSKIEVVVVLERRAVVECVSRHANGTPFSLRLKFLMNFFESRPRGFFGNEGRTLTRALTGCVSYISRFGRFSPYSNLRIPT